MLDFFPANQRHRPLHPQAAYAHYVLQQHWVFMDSERMQYLTSYYTVQSLREGEHHYYKKWIAFKKILDLHTPAALRSLRQEVIQIRRKTNPD
jgi:hypothetical protein